MDGEIVDALLALLDERVAEYLPREVFGAPAHLLEGLVHGHGAHRHGAVAQYPLARLVYVVARREVHQRVASPLAAPNGLLHLFVNARGGGRVAYVCVYLYKEVGAYHHRFRLGVVDVGRYDGAPGGHLLAHELGRDVGLYAQLGAVHVLANGHILHLFGYHPALGKGHLRLSRLALGYPGGTQLGQAALEVGLHVGVAVRAAGVIHVDGSVLRHNFLAVNNVDGRGQTHPAHAHSEVGIELSAHVNLFRTRVSNLDIVVHN